MKERTDAAALFLLRWLSVQLYLEEVDTAKTEELKRQSERLEQPGQNVARAFATAGGVPAASAAAW